MCKKYECIYYSIIQSFEGFSKKLVNPFVKNVKINKFSCLHLTVQLLNANYKPEYIY